MTPLSHARRAALERIVRGFANHRRIQILYLLDETPDVELRSIATRCGIKMQTATEHTRRLVAADLIRKRKKGRSVLHACTPLAGRVLQFLNGL
jgi:DNA-binding MarR family transcriptional regulator